MIAFKGYNNKPIYIVRSKIVGVQEKTPDLTTIFVGCISSSEEWDCL